MSVAWWNPNDLSLNSDSYQSSHSGFHYRSQKTMRLVDGSIIATIGDSRVRYAMSDTLLSDVVLLNDQAIPIIKEASLLHYRDHKLHYISISDHIASVYQLDPAQYYAIGYGADAVMVLSDLGHDDRAIGEALVKRIAYVAAPFSKIIATNRL